MTIRDTLCTLGLTQTEFAALIGVSVRAVNQWCTGAVPTPEPIERILMLMERVPGVVEELKLARDAHSVLPVTKTDRLHHG